MADDAQTEAPIAAAPTAPAAAATARNSALTQGADAGETKPYLTTRQSDEFGSYGRFVDLLPADAKAHLDDGLLVEPTEDQLALR